MVDYTLLSRSEWLILADRFYERLRPGLAELAPDEWERTTPYLGWRARDVLAHMTGALPVNFRQVLDRALADQTGPPKEFNTFARNRKEVERRRAQPVGEILHEFWSELDKILATYRAMTDEDFLRPAWFFVGPVQVRTLFLVQLSDNIFHERDILLPNRKWRGIEGEHVPYLVDWFLREVRPANLRPGADGFHATILYRLSGPGGGEWTMEVSGARCQTRSGPAEQPDVVVEAQVEDLIAAGQARAAPWVGFLARKVERIRGPGRTEDVVAALTGAAALGFALAGRKIRFRGPSATVRPLMGRFWHFWERTEQTEQNIALGLGEES